MLSPDALIKKVFALLKESDFDSLCLEVFRYQANNCWVYKTYINNLGINIDTITTPDKIPFLPIEFFKTHKVVSGKDEVEKTFESSGTTGSTPSKHYVADVSIYRQSFLKTFSTFYGNPSDWCIIGLLPSYLERENSSLVYMVDELIKLSGHKQNGFYLHDTDALIQKIEILKKNNQKIWLIGVTYALLDLAEKYNQPLYNTVVVETGGMKGKRPELIKQEVHEILRNKFSLQNIHSEYGMTELLSQAYSQGAGIFHTPPWMKIFIRDTNDPLSLEKKNKMGGINVIDLANIYSCSFIATQDLGKLHTDETFEVLGRFDNSDVRGCNLLYQP